MHPDFSLVLQKCASNLSLKHKPSLLYCLNSQAATMSCSTAESLHSPKDDGDDAMVRIVSDDEDIDEEEEADEEEFTKSPIKAMRQSSPLDQEDNISMCSELSVGQEHPGEDTRRPVVEEEEILDISDTHSNSSNDERNATPSTPGESPLNPFALANTLRFPVPFGLQAASAASLGPSSNISPFQEEFLRKSHLYAEELMKHQMHLMAAARASAFTLRSQNLHNATGGHIGVPAPSLVHINPLTKIGQISAAAAAAALTAAAAQQHAKPLNNQHHHHSHPHHPHQQHIIPPPHPALSLPHSQHHVTHTPTSDTLAKLTALSKQTSSSSTSQMMSTLNQLQTQMQAHLPGLLHDNNDNLHERALKFSIDNILKADFGRGQSPPLTKKSHHFHKSLGQRQHKSASSSASSTTSNNTTLSDSLDQTPQQIASSSATSITLGHSGSSSIPASAQTFSSSLASICTNSNDSNSTAVSSSYSSANGTGDLIKSSPSQTPTLSPGLTEVGGGGKLGSTAGKSSTEEGSTSATSSSTGGTSGGGSGGPIVWPAWVYCTRYSDRPSSGPRVRKPKKSTTPTEKANSPTGASSSAAASGSTSTTAAATSSASSSEDKRPRTAFSGSQLARLKHEFNENRYLTEKRRQQLSSELGLNEAQIKIWFQNKRAKLKKSSGVKNPLALQLMAQGLYNHSTIPLTREEEELQELQEREKANSNNNMPQPTAGAVSS